MFFYLLLWFCVFFMWQDVFMASVFLCLLLPEREADTGPTWALKCVDIQCKASFLLGPWTLSWVTDSSLGPGLMWL